MAKKYQQGGVSVYNIPSYPIPQVGGIPNSPMINAPLIPQADLSTLLDTNKTAETRQRQYEQDLARQQSQLASEKDKYFAIQDQLFGEVHNEAQRAALKAALAKQGASMEAVLAANDITTVRKEFDNARRALYSPDVQRILGQVEAADRYLQRKGPQNMADDQRTAYKNYADSYFKETDPAKVFDYDPMKLDENYWYSPPAATTKPISLSQALSSTLSRAQYGIDPDDPTQWQSAKYLYAGYLSSQGEDQAVKEGWLSPDVGASGIRELTPKSEQALRAGLEVSGAAQTAKQNAQLTLAQQKRDYNVAHPMPNTSTGKETPEQKTLNQATELWKAVMALKPDSPLVQKYSQLDITKYPAILNHLASLAAVDGTAKILDRAWQRTLEKDLDRLLTETPVSVDTPKSTTGAPVVTLPANTTINPAAPPPKKDVITWVGGKKYVNGKPVQ